MQEPDKCGELWLGQELIFEAKAANNKLTIDFEKAGEKRVLDSFVTLAD